MQTILKPKYNVRLRFIKFLLLLSEDLNNFFHNIFFGFWFLSAVTSNLVYIFKILLLLKKQTETKQKFQNLWEFQFPWLENLLSL